MKRFARKLHRLLAYVVFIQVTLWAAGGVTFALLRQPWRRRHPRTG
jgi:hypothetical protein